MRIVYHLLLVLGLTLLWHPCDAQRLSDERVVFQTTKGDIELAFFPDVAPVTVAHILDLCRRGLYQTNHFFRVDKGFVAQVADVVGGRRIPMDAYQQEVASKKLPGEFSDEVKHRFGTLSMGRYDDPNSATSSFSILLGDAPHLDGQYAIFGRITRGEAALQAMQQVRTKREGIFVMPEERIEIVGTYVKDASRGGGELRGQAADCTTQLEEARHRADGLVTELEKLRQKRLPGRR
jgi:cyclophilin family peptidyl-prolyl cis-trans isomerase